MVRIDFTLAIARPPADVFARLVDLDRLPDWQESSLVSSADGPLELGRHVKERRRIMGRELETELEVTACDPPRQLTLKALGGPVPFTVDHQLVDDNGSTLLHVVGEAKPGTFMKLAEPMIARTAEQELRRDFDAAEGAARGRGTSG